MIGESSQLVANADGSIDIWFGAQHPGPAWESNWLPTPVGIFSVMMRIYLPTEQVKNHVGTAAARRPAVAATRRLSAGVSEW